MGSFSNFNDFLQMGDHGLYVWLSYFIALLIIVYNIVSIQLKKRSFFIQSKRRLRRENKSS
jgi:heme exporter protein D